MGQNLCQHIQLVDKKTVTHAILNTPSLCLYQHSPPVSPHLCLMCPSSILCDQPSQTHNCLQRHRQETTHCLSLVLSSGFVVCFLCTNDFEDMVQSYKGPDEAQLKKCQAFYSFVKKKWAQRKEAEMVLSEEDKTLSFGLVNLGNTCFFNAVVQAMCLDDYSSRVRTLEYDAKIKFIPFSKEVEYYYDEILEKEEGVWTVVSNKKSQLKYLHKPVSDCSINKEYKKLLETAFGQGVVSSSGLFDSVSRIYPLFKEYKQQDAQEFLRIFLDALKEGELRCMAFNTERYKRIEQIVGARKLTLVDYYYGCYLANKVVCVPCDETSWTLDLALDFNVEINKKPVKIEISDSGLISRKDLKYHVDLKYPEGAPMPQILQSFFSFESLSTFKCPKCQLSNSIRKFYVVQPPKVLTIVLKRFKSDMSKDSTFIPFEQILDISGVTLSPADEQSLSLLYQLSSVVVHQGSSDQYGHYVCYRRMGDHWLLLSDEQVKVVSWAKVQTVQAYILFYNRA